MRERWSSVDRQDWQLKLSAPGIPLERHLSVVDATRRASQAIDKRQCPNGCGRLRSGRVDVHCPRCGFQFSEVSL